MIVGYYPIQCIADYHHPIGNLWESPFTQYNGMNFRNTEDPVDVEDVEDRRGAGLCLEIHTSAEGLQRDGGAHCAAAGATQLWQLRFCLAAMRAQEKQVEKCTVPCSSIIFYSWNHVLSN